MNCGKLLTWELRKMINHLKHRNACYTNPKMDIFKRKGCGKDLFILREFSPARKVTVGSQPSSLRQFRGH